MLDYISYVMLVVLFLEYGGGGLDLNFDVKKFI